MIRYLWWSHFSMALAVGSMGVKKRRRFPLCHVCVCPCRCAFMALAGLCLSVWLTPPTHVAPTLAFLNLQPTGNGHQWTHSLTFCLSPSFTFCLFAILPTVSLPHFTRAHGDFHVFLTPLIFYWTHTLKSGHKSNNDHLHSHISL